MPFFKNSNLVGRLTCQLFKIKYVRYKIFVIKNTTLVATRFNYPLDGSANFARLIKRIARNILYSRFYTLHHRYYTRYSNKIFITLMNSSGIQFNYEFCL